MLMSKHTMSPSSSSPSFDDALFDEGQKDPSSKKDSNCNNPVKYHSFRYSFSEGKTESFMDHTIIFNLLNSLCANFIFQLEETITPDGRQNLHYQGFIELLEKTRSSTLGKSLNSVLLGVQFQPCHDRVALKQYSMKTDTRVGGPWSNKNIYSGDDLVQISKCRRPWQEIIFQEIQQSAHDRKVICVIDIKGNNGKSKLAKFLTYRNLSLTLNYGNSRDLLYLVSKHLDKKCFLFDLTRSKPQEVHFTDLFSAIESVKNGHIQSLKYTCEYHLFTPPHTILFTNSVPDLYGVSPDRWSFYTILDQDLYFLNFKDVHSLALYQAELQSKLQGRYDSDSGTSDSDSNEKKEKISLERFNNLLYNRVRDYALCFYPCNFQSGSILHGKKRERF